jgi:hypothetical protein
MVEHFKLIGTQAFRQELSDASFYAIIPFEVVAHGLYSSSHLIAANNLTEVYYYLPTTSPVSLLSKFCTVEKIIIVF